MTQELLSRVHRELLDVLNSINQDKIHHDGDDFHELLNDVEKALAQPEQEPVAWWNDTGTHIDLNVSGRGAPLYTAPPQRREPVIDKAAAIRIATALGWTPPRTWVKLTDEEISGVLGSDIHDEPSGELRFIRAIEAKLKEKNNG